MNSNNASSGPVRQIELNWALFEVVFQVTVQLRELPVEHVLDRGLTQHQLQVLIDLLREIRGIVEQRDRVRIYVIDECTDPLSAAIVDTSLDTDLRRREVVAKLPISIEVVWIPLLKYTASWLGERELFLRTGYHMNEVSDSIAALSRCQ